MSEKKEYPIKTRIVRITDKKTGVVYLEERRTQYDPQKGWNRVISTRRTGEKIVEGKTEPQKCRPKRHSGDSKVIANASTAERKRVGMTQILEWVGSESGVDKAVYDGFPSRAVAEKILSVARYLVATNKTVHNIADFQYEHDLPYEHGLSEDVCYDLFRDVGHDEASTQRLFQRLSEIGQVEQGVIAFDSTTISTYAQGEQTPFARQGYNKDGDGLDTYKMLTMFSVASGLPISFELQPGNIPDVSSLVNTVKRLETYQIKKPLLILDNGFFSKANIAHLCREHVGFTIRASLGDSWIIDHIDTTSAKGREVRREFQRMDSICPFASEVTGVTVTAKTELTWTRKRNRSGKTAGTTERFSRLLHFHYFKDETKAIELRTAFRDILLDLKNRIEAGKNDFSEDENRYVKRYLNISRRGRAGLKVEFNEEACKDVMSDFGMFVLISNTEADRWAALRHYRQRTIIEKTYSTIKTELDGRHPRVWTRASDRGKEVCRLIALGYRFYLQNAIYKAASLAETISDDQTKRQADREAHEKAAAWLRKVSLSQFLNWFDCIEHVEVVNSIGKRRWTTETTVRDRLVRELLMGKNQDS